MSPGTPSRRDASPGQRHDGILFRLNTSGHRAALLLFVPFALLPVLDGLARVCGGDRGRSWASIPQQLLRTVMPDTSAQFVPYVCALLLLVGLWVLRIGFKGRAAWWWLGAFWVQFWHHLEHAVLEGQVIAGRNLFQQAAPTSLLGLLLPQDLLHLAYATLVLLFMVGALARHRSPAPAEAVQHNCGCARRADRSAPTRR